jgi:hypothetical protein
MARHETETQNGEDSRRGRGFAPGKAVRRRHIASLSHPKGALRALGTALDTVNRIAVLP